MFLCFFFFSFFFFAFCFGLFSYRCTSFTPILIPFATFKSCLSIFRTFHFISSHFLLNFPLSCSSSVLWVIILLHGQRFCLPLDLKSLCQIQPFCPLFLWNQRGHTEKASLHGDVIHSTSASVACCPIIPICVYVCVSLHSSAHASLCVRFVGCQTVRFAL